MNTDRIFYVAFNDFGSDIGAEVSPSMTAWELVENIRKGEGGFDNVVKVFAFNPVEHTADDVTDVIFEAVEKAIQRIKDADDFPVSLQAADPYPLKPLSIKQAARIIAQSEAAE